MHHTAFNLSNRIANLLYQSFPRRRTGTLQVWAGNIGHKATGQAQSIYDVDMSRFNKGSCSTSENSKPAGCSSKLKLQVITDAAASADARWLQKVCEDCAESRRHREWSNTWNTQVGLPVAHSSILRLAPHIAPWLVPA